MVKKEDGRERRAEDTEIQPSHTHTPVRGDLQTLTPTITQQ